MTATRIHVIAAITAIVIAATAITTTLPAAAQQSTIHIIKHVSNSYAISGGSSTVAALIQLTQLQEKEAP
jgi:hypothetical protein